MSLVAIWYNEHICISVKYFIDDTFLPFNSAEPLNGICPDSSTFIRASFCGDAAAVTAFVEAGKQRRGNNSKTCMLYLSLKGHMKRKRVTSYKDH